MLMRNGCACLHTSCFQTPETTNSSEEFAYEKALETANLRPYDGMNELFGIRKGHPQRTSITTKRGGADNAPANTKFRYLI
jgi:hypothetical protein